jgi:hypothetical protein
VWTVGIDVCGTALPVKSSFKKLTVATTFDDALEHSSQLTWERGLFATHQIEVALFRFTPGELSS